jgi:hypothetical protein
MPGNMESYRPFTEHDKRMMKLRYEPRAYEYKIPLRPADMTIRETPAERETTSLGLLVRALLKSLNCLPEGSESGIEAAGK